MKSLLFTAILSNRKRSEQILIKFAILLQVRLTHAQTFFRGVPNTRLGCQFPMRNATEKRQTSQGYIIRILQHFATKLWNITNFVMLFQAVMKFLSRAKF